MNIKDLPKGLVETTKKLLETFTPTKDQDVDRPKNLNKNQENAWRQSHKANVNLAKYLANKRGQYTPYDDNRKPTKEESIDETPINSISHHLVQRNVHRAEQDRMLNLAMKLHEKGKHDKAKSYEDIADKHNVLMIHHHARYKSLSGLQQDEEIEHKGYKVGDIVKPNIGPHKGHPHRVIHVHPDNSVNIAPQGLKVNQIKYKLGATHAHAHQLSEGKITGPHKDRPNKPKTKKWAKGSDQKEYGVDKDREVAKTIKKLHKESLDSIDEAHEVRDSASNDRGDRYELRVHNKGHPAEYHTIIKTHQGGKSTQNQWGGYNTVRLGAPKYVAGHWRSIKGGINKPTYKHAIPLRSEETQEQEDEDERTKEQTDKENRALRGPNHKLEESNMGRLSHDFKNLAQHEFIKKWGKSKESMKKALNTPTKVKPKKLKEEADKETWHYHHPVTGEKHPFNVPTGSSEDAVKQRAGAIFASARVGRGPYIRRDIKVSKLNEERLGESETPEQMRVRHKREFSQSYNRLLANVQDDEGHKRVLNLHQQERRQNKLYWEKQKRHRVTFGKLTKEESLAESSNEPPNIQRLALTQEGIFDHGKRVRTRKEGVSGFIAQITLNGENEPRNIHIITDQGKVLVTSEKNVIPEESHDDLPYKVNNKTGKLVQIKKKLRKEEPEQNDYQEKGDESPSEKNDKNPPKQGGKTDTGQKADAVDLDPKMKSAITAGTVNLQSGGTSAGHSPQGGNH